MPPRLYIIRATRSLAIRMRPIAPRQPRIAKIASRRCFANGQTPATGGSESGIGHVNEEAVDMGNITGGTTPDLNQGTPVQEVRCWELNGNFSFMDVMTSEIILLI